MSILSKHAVIPEHFKLDLRPLAAADAVVQAGHARFTVLTDRLIRLEYHAEGRFEDRASQAFWFRAQPVPDFRADVTADAVEIETDDLILRYHGGPFTDKMLSITLKTNGVTWHPGDPACDNLLGTTRTLDFVNGYAPLEPGLMSRAGWALLDNSATLVFDDDGWIEPRAPGGTDLVFFRLWARLQNVSARLLPGQRTHPADPTLDSRQLVEPLLGLYAGRSRAVDPRFRSLRAAFLGVYRRHGLAPHQNG